MTNFKIERMLPQMEDSLGSTPASTFSPPPGGPLPNEESAIAPYGEEVAPGEEGVTPCGEEVAPYGGEATPSSAAAALPEDEKVHIDEGGVMEREVPGRLVSVAHCSSESVLLKVEIMVKGKSVLAIVDSGSSRSLMSKSACENLMLSKEILPEPSRISTINEKSLMSNGNVKCDLKVQGFEMVEQKFLIFDQFDFGVDVILGVDFLEGNQIEVVPNGRMLIKHYGEGGKAEIYLDEMGRTKNVMFCDMLCYAVSNVTIPQGKTSEISIEHHIPEGYKEGLFFYTGQEIDEKLATAGHNVDGVTDGRNKMVLMMASGEDLCVKEGQLLGTVSSVLELPESEMSADSALGWSEIRDTIKLDCLEDEQKQRVFEMLDSIKTVFSAGESDIGRACVTEHSIKISDSTPIYQKPRRFSPPVNDEIEKQCQELFSSDIIEPSFSPWNSPIVPVRKRDGSIRLCIDYRALNRKTIPDKFPVPNLSDSIFGLHGTAFFTKLDLIRGYYQMPLEDESRPLTAFSSNRNHWQFKRLSFGLRNAPASFQREIQAVLSGFPSNKVIVFIDDILIMGSSFAEHLTLVFKVLKTLEKYGIKIKPSKCEWFQHEVDYLGHRVSRTGIRKTREYVEKVKAYPRPQTVGQLREFLGMVNFQRKFVPHCSEIQKPLSCLTGGKSKSKLLEWTEEMIESFEKLKLEIEKDIELTFPDYGEEASKIELWADASNVGAGAYLSQEQEGVKRIIGFASMSFTGSQLNYSTLERELTALRWGIKTFKPFLYGVNFILYTDHQPLVYLHNMKLVCSRLARIVEELAEFVFEIRYVPGQYNTAADALSRIGVKGESLDGNDVNYDVPNGLILNGCPVPGGGDSLFVSLLRSLRQLTMPQRMPSSELELRHWLVEELLKNCTRYQLKLDRSMRKRYNLMRYAGQLPSMEVILAASHLFKVSIHVYYWSRQPVIYQIGECQKTIHLQCISGIHFNSLVELNTFVPPDPQQCPIVTAHSPCHPVESADEGSWSAISDPEDEEVLSFLNIDTNLKYCDHECSSVLPQVGLKFGDNVLCSVLDTGAEVSLLTKTGLKMLEQAGSIMVESGYWCSIVGCSGEVTALEHTVDVEFKIGGVDLGRHKFGVIDDKLLPHCVLLGLDFLLKNNLSIDFKNYQVNMDGKRLASMTNYCQVQKYKASIYTCRAVESRVLVTVDQSSSGGIRFHMSGSPESLEGLTWRSDPLTEREMQAQCPRLRQVFRMLKGGKLAKDWPKTLRTFTRYKEKLTLINDVICINLVKPVIVVPENVYCDIAMKLHHDFAHIGRDKLLNLMSSIVWNPSQYKICNDIASTCYVCQTVKEYRITSTPPTWKISSERPFQLVAIDLLSLPTTSRGNVACLVVVDHYSKWVAAVPLRDKRSSTVVRALTERVFPFLAQVPCTIISDNGPEFVSDVFSECLASRGINHQLTTPYRPQSNGAVERVNRTITGFLRSLGESPGRWDEYLCQAVITYNNTLHVELGMSPSEFLLTNSHSSDNLVTNEMTKYWKAGNPRFLPFKVNDLVLRKSQKLGNLNANKFKENFSGPYRVVKANDNGVTYEIKCLESGAIVRAHFMQLRKFKEIPRYLKKYHDFREGLETLQAGRGDEYVGTNLQNEIGTDCEASLDTSARVLPDRRDETSESDSSDDSLTSQESIEDADFTAVGVEWCEPKDNVCKGCQFEEKIEMEVIRYPQWSANVENVTHPHLEVINSKIDFLISSNSVEPMSSSSGIPSVLNVRPIREETTPDVTPPERDPQVESFMQRVDDWDMDEASQSEVSEDDLETSSDIGFDPRKFPNVKRRIHSELSSSSDTENENGSFAGFGTEAEVNTDRLNAIEGAVADCQEEYRSSFQNVVHTRSKGPLKIDLRKYI